jgi:two-component system response regulator NreC
MGNIKTTERITIMLVGFHVLFYEGLRSFLDTEQNVELLPFSRKSNQDIRRLKQAIPKVIMIDSDGIDSNIIDTIVLIKKNHPDVAVLTFCSPCDERHVIRMIEAGANGVIFKNSGKEEIIKAIKTISLRKKYYCPDTSKKLVDYVINRFDPNASISPEFTNRELSIIIYICKEYTNKEIADELSLSIRTVEEHRNNIAKKIGAKNAVGIALYAFRNKLVR